MKKIGVFTSGGDAPGMNACIRSVVRSCLFHNIDPYGIKYGYAGMIAGDIYKMKSLSVSNIVQKGGTILKSSRSKEFLSKEGRKKAFEHINRLEIEGIVAIGGNGTFTGANIFYEEYGVPIIGIPGTIDNDLYGSDYTLGFDTAVNTALEAIDKIRDTANSHDRVFFVEVMGRHSGYIALQTGIGGGSEFVVIPEIHITIEDMVNNIKKLRDSQQTSLLIIVAEGSSNGDVNAIVEKIIPHLQEMEIRVSKLGHIQRGGNPTAFDRILASHLGLAAVEGLMNGQKNVMVGIVDNKITFTNLKIAISQEKKIDSNLLRLIDILRI
ncbi:MAG: 6-phosphofructokinase [Chitinophagaceae bacterium]|nr:6-phosphofructokinase [Chitinophagaceae bacterium]